MDLIILAGGAGTRLKSVVKDIPKPMAPIGGKPFLGYLMKHLERFDIGNVIFATCYMSDFIENWVRAQNFPFNCKFSVEEYPLGTGGAIKKAIKLAQSDRVAIVNGDTFFNVDLDDLDRFGKSAGTPITIALKPMENFERYGNVELSEKGLITNFKEKEFCRSGMINGGIYIMEKSGIFENLAEKFSMENDVLQPLSKLGKISGMTCDNYFIDIGIPEDYERASRELPHRINI